MYLEILIQMRVHVKMYVGHIKLYLYAHTIEKNYLKKIEERNVTCQLPVFLFVLRKEEHICELGIHQFWPLPAHHNQVKALTSAISATPESTGSLVLPGWASIGLSRKYIQRNSEGGKCW